MNVGYSEFERYAKGHLGISGMQLHNFEKLQESKLYNKELNGMMTPMILEEREMRVSIMSVFDRLMRDRILWVAGPVNDYMAIVVQAQLMFLDKSDKSDIRMYVDTPGGSVKAGLQMVDIMDFIDCDIETVNTGMCASMGSVILGAGTKGKRGSLRFSKVMLHQSSGGAGGNIQDAEIEWKEWTEVNNTLFDLLGSYCGKPAKQVKKDSTRDFWLSAKEALDYGIIDYIIPSKSR